MASTKRNSLIIAAVAVFVLALACCPAATVRAAKKPVSSMPDKSEEIDEATRLAAVAANCADIKYTLTQLQRSDSRTRTYLGTSYEAVLGRFITPLALRLERNGLSSERLSAIQTEFISSQNEFRAAYTDYMRSLEDLIAIDCSNHPEDFYTHLVTTREKRSALQSIVQKLNSLVGAQYNAVAELEKSL